MNMYEYGWEEDPPDNDLIRARTKLGQLRLWHFTKEGFSASTYLILSGPSEKGSPSKNKRKSH